MVLDMFYEENTKVVVSYLPVWEFFFSMHVLEILNIMCHERNGFMQRKQSFLM